MYETFPTTVDFTSTKLIDVELLLNVQVVCKQGFVLFEIIFTQLFRLEWEPLNTSVQSPRETILRPD